MTIHMTAAELAQQIGGEAEGDLTKLLTGVAPLAEAGEAEVAFADSDRALEAARASRAGCLLVSLSAQLPGQTLIRVRNPKLAMARAAGIFNPEPEPKPGIHPSAVLGGDCQIGEEVTIGPLVSVGIGARIGARTRIGAGCVVGAQVSIGEQCVLHPRVTLYPGARLGSRVILHSGSVIGADGFGYVFEKGWEEGGEEGRHIKFPQVGWVEIGDDVEIGANTTIDRGALGATRIGRGTKIDNLVQIAHNVQIGAHCAIAAQTGISGSAVIEDYVVIAGQAGIGDHARVSQGAVLGGQCGILPHKVAKAGQPLWGTPARPLRDILEQQAALARLPRLLKFLNRPSK